MHRCLSFPATHSSTVYCYFFQRHISDGSFHLASEKKLRILPGLFSKPEALVTRYDWQHIIFFPSYHSVFNCRGLPHDLEARIDEVVSAAEARAPPVVDLEGAAGRGREGARRTPALIRISPQVLDRVGGEGGGGSAEEVARVAAALSARMRNSTNLLFSEPEGEEGTAGPSLGTLSVREAR